MNIGDRLKILRKEHLNGISQDRFADIIGTSGAAISRYESSDRAIPNSIILSICREFNVNREWLEEGKGKPFCESKSDTLDKIAKRYNGSETFRAMLDVYARLTADQQDAFEQYVSMLTEAIASGQSPETVAPPETSINADAYIQERTKPYPDEKAQ